MDTKNLKQEIIIKCSPHEVFEAFMDSKKHTKITESKVKISKEKEGSI